MSFYTESRETLQGKAATDEAIQLFWVDGLISDE